MVVTNAMLAMVCPGEVEVAERRHLIQADQPVPVQLQHRQEPRHDLIGSGTVGDELPERGSAQGPQPC